MKCDCCEKEAVIDYDGYLLCLGHFKKFYIEDIRECQFKDWYVLNKTKYVK